MQDENIIILQTTPGSDAYFMGFIVFFPKPTRAVHGRFLDNQLLRQLLAQPCLSCYHLGMHKILIKSLVLPVLAATLLAACNPTYNWRDYSSQDAPFRVMFPDKPATHTRSIDLDGMKVNMTMTAVDIDGTMYAVGSAEAPDTAKAQAALGAMKTALVRNLGATITKEKSSATSSASGAGSVQRASIDIEATGVRDGTPMKLIGHFEARNKRFYQVIVMGKEKAVMPEQTEQFMSSFKLS
jgi:hypothetical protein